MDQKTDRLYASAPSEEIDLEQKLEKKKNDVNSFNNHINNIKEMITYFKIKNDKSKKTYKNYKNSKHSFRISRQFYYHWSNVNFYNFIDYWCSFDLFTNISWKCIHIIIR